MFGDAAGSTIGAIPPTCCGFSRMGRGPRRAMLMGMHRDAPSPAAPDTLRVVVAGGGVAGLETLVALRALAGDRVAATLVAPDDAFAMRALDVFEPFGLGRAHRYALAEQVKKYLGRPPGAFIRPRDFRTAYVEVLRSLRLA